jgi:hypothetical protein
LNIQNILRFLQEPDDMSVKEETEGIHTKGQKMKLDLTVSPNNPLYAGLGVVEVGGRANLPDATSAKVVNVFGAAIAEAVAQIPAHLRGEVVLTGPAPVQLYLVAFHGVLHAFRTVRYQDGRGGDVVVAQHG